ncbi:MAG TPA: YceI family protein [Saprospiraceae bacterium]|nr:YceI family protein [Saprospiraceae bacterium]
MKNLISVFFLGFIAFSFVACKGKGGDASTVAGDTTAVNVSTTDGGSQVFHVVTTASKLYWEGYKPAQNRTHTGTVNISKGTLSLKGDMIQGGSVVFDMNSITDTDLEGEMKSKLEAHLKGTAQGKENDFFNVTQYPTGKFEITKVATLENDAEANTMIYGNLTLKDITRPVAFKANVNVVNGTLTATAPLFKIDRTEWGIKVLSKKFFDNLKDDFVDDQFGLRIELRAESGKDI